MISFGFGSAPLTQIPVRPSEKIQQPLHSSLLQQPSHSGLCKTFHLPLRCVCLCRAAFHSSLRIAAFVSSFVVVETRRRRSTSLSLPAICRRTSSGKLLSFIVNISRPSAEEALIGSFLCTVSSRQRLFCCFVSAFVHFPLAVQMSSCTRSIASTSSHAWYHKSSRLTGIVSDSS